MAQQAKEVKSSERGNPLHPALAESHELDFSIDKTLFDAVLNDERVREWQTSNDTWQLRFSGSPGCGKTTLSSIIVETLREKATCVASIYLQQDVTSDETAFIEDFLWFVYSQLSKHVPDVASTPNEEEGRRTQYDEYVAARIVEQPGLHRTSLIRSALQAIVPSLPKPTFLVVDDIDRCSPETFICIEEELLQLQHRGVKIMTTSRIPSTGEFWTAAQCDGQECAAKYPRPWIHVYWACEDCMRHDDKDTRGTTVFCRACWPGRAECVRCNNTSRFKQPFDRLDFDISHVPDHAMDNFIRRAIQQEHGDVGLCGPQPTPEDQETSLPLPPFTSNLGLQLLRPNSDMAERVVRGIVKRAQGNMALAHKRLELFHRARLVEAFLAPRDRLPASIVEIFDAGLRSVEAQASPQRELGLQAIAIVGRSIDGVPFEQFRRLVRECGVKKGQYDAVSVEDDKGKDEIRLREVSNAAKGFVIQQNDRRRSPRLMAFHYDFYLYCGQGYRESIVRANNSLHDVP
ncbi:hypothetical protein PG985_012916 [Apiospora marii]|uniref:uncharacterized protein n=1 Tax=Apiospora marii TaxID=335849 RepID=UPI00312E6BB6